MHWFERSRRPVGAPAGNPVAKNAIVTSVKPIWRAGALP
jgi:hypothetical protein